MKKPNFLYSIWAVFNNKEQRQLENLKKKVNKALKGPYFPIHMTVSFGCLFHSYHYHSIPMII